jgi:hypothetical protein
MLFDRAALLASFAEGRPNRSDYLMYGRLQRVSNRSPWLIILGFFTRGHDVTPTGLRSCLPRLSSKYLRYSLRTAD